MAGSHTEEHVMESRWGMSSCAICGATLVLGERPARIRISGRWEPLCGACASRPAAAVSPLHSHASEELEAAA